MVRRALTVLAALAAAYAAVVGAAWVFQRSLVYFPDGDVPPAATVLPGAEEVTIPTSDRLEVHGWYLPATGEELAAAVVFNGNAGNRAGRALLARRLAAAGISTLLFDYRGYGGNPGRPSEEGLYLDGRAAADYLASRSAAPQVYLGESLGSAVATEVALTRPPAALILRSPFTSLADVGKAHYPFLPVGWLLADRYPTGERIAGVPSPVLVVASIDDEVVPFRLSEAVHAAATGEKRLVTYRDAGHNDAALTHGPQLVADIVAFVRAAVVDS